MNNRQATNEGLEPAITTTVEGNSARMQAPLLSEPLAFLGGTRLSATGSPAALKKHANFLMAVLENLGEGILVTDRQERITYVNAQAEKLLGWSAADLIGANIHEKVHRQPSDQSNLPAHRCLLRQVLANGGSAQVEDDVFIRRDGDSILVACTASSIHVAGLPEGLAVVAFREVQSRGHSEASRRHHALHDRLTGLPTQTLLEDRLHQALLSSRRDGQGVAVLSLDIDRLKDINDAFGYDEGDQLLTEVAFRLRRAVRESDTIARVRGDEFALLVPGVASLDAASGLAVKLLQAMEEPFTFGDRSLQLTASIGVVIHPFHGDSVAMLLQRAQLAMHSAKRQRRGYAIYGPEQDRAVADRLSLTTELRRAIGEDGLALYYQPKVAIATGQLLGVEALARWPHPRRGYVEPDQFVPIAEMTGLIRPLTKWVLNAALRQLQAWHAQGISLRMAVNVSTHDLQDPGFADELFRLLDESKAEPSRLQLEITETMIMRNPSQVMSALKRLYALGIDFAIDDFGTGYSSLTYLRDLPAHEIKIDKSFVLDLLTDDRDATIVHSVIDLAHALGRATVAEGVNTGQTLEALAALGCDVAQGYHIGKPMPAAEFGGWLEMSPYSMPAAVA